MRFSAIDVHQHLWPAELVDRLRARVGADQVTLFARGDEVWCAGDISRPGTNSELVAGGDAQLSQHRLL
jgi:hypothetical protein